MRLTDWVLYDRSITRYKTEVVLNTNKYYEDLRLYKNKIAKNVLEINFSNYKSNNTYADEFCWFEVRLLDDCIKDEKKYFHFNSLFEAILFCDNWAVNKGYEIKNPLFIPEIGKPYRENKELVCGYKY